MFFELLDGVDEHFSEDFAEHDTIPSADIFFLQLCADNGVDLDPQFLRLFLEHIGKACDQTRATRVIKWLCYPQPDKSSDGYYETANDCWDKIAVLLSSDDDIISEYEELLTRALETFWWSQENDDNESSYISFFKAWKKFPAHQGIVEEDIEELFESFKRSYKEIVGCEFDGDINMVFLRTHLIDES
jgi:hypothetical protein